MALTEKSRRPRSSSILGRTHLRQRARHARSARVGPSRYPRARVRVPSGVAPPSSEAVPNARVDHEVPARLLREPSARRRCRRLSTTRSRSGDWSATRARASRSRTKPPDDVRPHAPAPRRACPPCAAARASPRPRAPGGARASRRATRRQTRGGSIDTHDRGGRHARAPWRRRPAGVASRRSRPRTAVTAGSPRDADVDPAPPPESPGGRPLEVVAARRRARGSATIMRGSGRAARPRAHGPPTSGARPRRHARVHEIGRARHRPAGSTCPGLGHGLAGPADRARVELAVHRAHGGRRQMRVDLRRRDVGVAQHRLHRAQVGAALEEMAREGMPQGVRRDRAAQPATASPRA